MKINFLNSTIHFVIIKIVYYFCFVQLGHMMNEKGVEKYNKMLSIFNSILGLDSELATYFVFCCCIVLSRSVAAGQIWCICGFGAVAVDQTHSIFINLM